MEQAVALRFTRFALETPLPRGRISIYKRGLSNVVQASKKEPVPKWYKQFKQRIRRNDPDEVANTTVTMEKPIPTPLPDTATMEKPTPRVTQRFYSEKPAEKTRATAKPPLKVSVKESRPTPEFRPFSRSAFGSLNLSKALVKRLQQEGYSSPTAIQASAIPLLLEGHDAAIQSYTGSGKTLAYLLPVLSTVGPLRSSNPEDTMVSDPKKPSKGSIEAVVVTPSRELGMQIVREAEKILGLEHRKLVQQMIGGANIKRQEEALKKNKPFLIVGTPGRISDLSRAGKLHTHGCRFLVLDESDQLLSLRYRTDMARILGHVGWRRAPPGQVRGDGTKVERQTVLVSATMPPAVLKAAEEWGRAPLLIKPEANDGGAATTPRTSKPETKEMADLRGARESLPPNLAHYYVVSPVRHRVDTLRRCINALDAKTVLVFMNFNHRLKDTVFKLQAKGLEAGFLHGDQGKMERANVLTAFKSQKIQILVVSEVGARGLDVPECDLVVNLELPTDATHYAHRGGRTGRLGREGSVVSICEQQEAFVLGKFEKQLGISIVQCEVSHGVLSLFDNKDSKEAPAPAATVEDKDSKILDEDEPATV